jgi:hypothetical protein
VQAFEPMTLKAELAQSMQFVSLFTQPLHVAAQLSHAWLDIFP